VTSADLAALLDEPSTTIETGIYEPVNFSKSAGFYPLTPRVAGSLFYSYIAEDGVYVPNGDVTTDLSGLADEMG
jgi:hypothetical protein